eukprot:TRINITY_DN2832_c1_g1_i1.p1 TRINITY_DN2832_c1_g1~~TRINITY_DN2832_c1_g1_i1.p1  ORF type:complete len:704 (+),score=182.01 TRINITY_DN2832_c1_g1_i1:102-2114(+)
MTAQPSAPILELSWNEGKTFDSKITDQTYDVPDQLEMMDYSSAMLDKSLDIVRNLSEYQHAAYSWNNWGIGFFGLFGLTFSHEAQFVVDLIKEGRYVVYVAHKRFQFFDIASWPYSIAENPHSMFNQYTAKLPEVYDENAYLEWVSLFGTNYFERAAFGGTIQYLIQVDTALIEKMTEEWVSTQVSLFITYTDIQFGFNAGWNVTKNNISSQFWEASTAYCQLHPFGTDGFTLCSNLTNGKFKTWISQAMQAPVMVAPALINITTLVADPIRRANIERTIITYLNTPLNASLPSPDVAPIRPIPKIHLQNHLRSDRNRRSSNLPPIPGWNFIGMGIDAAKMQFTILPSVYVNQTDNGNYQCQSADQYGPACWQNPFYPDDQFFVPNNVYVENTPESNLVNGSQIFTSYDDFEKYYSNGDSSSGFFGSSSNEVFKFYQKYYLQDRSMTFQDQTRSWYKLTLPPLPPPQPSPIVMKVFGTLPTQYIPSDPENVRLFQNAIRSLGTHVIYEAMFGGRQKLTCWFHKCLTFTFGAKFVDEQSSFSFFGIVTHHHGHTSETANINLHFLEYSSVEVEYVGGDAFAYEPQEGTSWVQSLRKRPIPTSYQLLPLSFIMQGYDPQRSAAYESAVTDYMTQSDAATKEAQSILKSQDPMSTPSWCHWTPPSSSTASSSN